MKDDCKIINGKRYVRNTSAFIDTLFYKGGTANGYYKETKAGIYLYDMQGKPRVFIRAKDGLTVSFHVVDGRKRYMFALCDSDKNFYEATI